MSIVLNTFSLLTRSQNNSRRNSLDDVHVPSYQTGTLATGGKKNRSPAKNYK